MSPFEQGQLQPKHSSATNASRWKPSHQVGRLSEAPRATEGTADTVQSDKQRFAHPAHPGTCAAGSLLNQEGPDASKPRAMSLRPASNGSKDSADVPVKASKTRAMSLREASSKEGHDASKPRATSLRPTSNGSKDSADGVPASFLQLPEVARSGRSTMRDRSDSKTSTGSVSSVREDDGRDASKFTRRLSFVDCSIEDLDQHFQAEFGGAEFFKHFWHGVLTQQPACRALSNRSLTNWVMIYTNWKVAAKWNGQAPDYMNTYELQDWLSAPLTRVLELVKLFDPSGYAKVNVTKATQDYNRVRVAVIPLVSACLILSQTLTTRQKIDFLFAIFDSDDNNSLSIDEFAALWVNLFRGLGCAFGVRETPQPRIVALAARKVFEQLEIGDRLPKKNLEDFLSGKLMDPVGVPISLVMQRFSVDANLVDPDSYVDESKRYKLSHKEPHGHPLEAYNLQDSDYLTRMEVVVARDVFQFCRSVGDFELSHSDAEKAIGKPIPVNMWCSRMSRALEEACALEGSSACFDLGTFLKKLCPRATATHLQMFKCWLQEYDRLQKQKVALQRSKEVLAELYNYMLQPVMTERVKQGLISSFHVVDRRDEGRVNTLDLQATMEVEKDTAKSMMKYFDTNGDGFVDIEEYIAAMCPEGHRLPPKVQDRIFDLLLSAEVERQEKIVTEQDALFKNSTERRATPCLKARSFLPKQVPDMVWEDWIAAWEALDVTKLGYLTRAQFRETRAMRTDVSEFLFDLIAGSSETDSISKDQFLKKLLEAAGFRPRSGVPPE
eukprot:s436_g58.t1